MQLFYFKIKIDSVEFENKSTSQENIFLTLLDTQCNICAKRCANNLRIFFAERNFYTDNNITVSKIVKE